MSTDEPVPFRLPHPVDAMCRKVGPLGAVVLFGGRQLVACDTQQEAADLLGIGFVEPRVAEESAPFK